MCNTVNDYNASAFCDGSGGVKEWYAFPTFQDDGKPTVVWTKTAGLITAVTVAATVPPFDIKTWQVEMQTSTFTDTAEGERTAKAKSRTQSATVVFHGSSAQLVADIDEMSGTRMTVIARDNRNLLHVLFLENGGSFRDAFTPGTMLLDQYAHTITLDGAETNKAPIISETILDNLINPA
jgi:hypothetical protein